ncbi:hypothetical protein TetV_065 [Tetraselmis virus 1]|uniref:Uncharacterized protein n=1 Tax=Tetraselmis virus 1 TaxID=2060617 RepID=A0A2P0VMM8_9VIRU|nr:hypothetical protein QJ968_gp065 [Tetraselmis virus 1]AUF82157.1 hypothetical protein TetV_065 [Tetraselmis virus 1]
MTSISIPNGCSTESWSFDSVVIESLDRWKCTKNVFSTPRLDALIRSHCAPVKKHRNINNNKESHRVDTVVQHLFMTSDPVNAVMGGSKWSPENALRELSRTNGRMDESVRLQLLQDNPVDKSSCFVDLCECLDVGLVVQESSGFNVICIRPDKNIWIEKNAVGWVHVPWCKNPVNQESLQKLINKSALDICRNCTSIKILRHCADSIGLPRPYPRSKEGLSEAIQGHLA